MPNIEGVENLLLKPAKGICVAECAHLTQISAATSIKQLEVIVCPKLEAIQTEGDILCNYALAW